MCVSLCQQDSGNKMLLRDTQGNIYQIYLLCTVINVKVYLLHNTVSPWCLCLYFIYLLFIISDSCLCSETITLVMTFSLFSHMIHIFFDHVHVFLIQYSHAHRIIGRWHGLWEDGPLGTDSQTHNHIVCNLFVSPCGCSASLWGSFASVCGQFESFHWALWLGILWQRHRMPSRTV